MFGKMILRILCIASLGICIAVVTCHLSSREALGALDSRDLDEIHLVRGDLETIKVFDLKRISITNPEVADTASIDGENILMLAKQSGKTTLFIWDKYGKRSIVLRVFEEDLELVKSRIEELLAKTDIEGIVLEISEFEGRVVVSGELSEAQKEEFDRLLEPFEKSVLNLVKQQEEEGLIQIDAQILEFTTSLSKTLGVDWTSALTYTETLPTGTIHELQDVFKLGKFARTTAITSTINALISEGKGRVLSQPKLVCVSGKEASFLVGGEIPITTTTTSSGGTVQENVSFKDYGVELTVNPTIRDDKKIDIQLTIDVSDIDASNAVGNDVAFTTRSAQTQLYLEDGQTVVLAGLIKVNESRTVSRIPGFSDIPLVGALFRRTATNAPTTELAIMLTPTILQYGSEETLSQQEQYEISSSYPAGITSGETTKAKAMKLAPASSAVVQGALSTQVYIPQEVLPYIRSVQERIAQRVAYPEQARRYGWEGTVKLALQILPDGTLASASVQESSGYDLFDEHALTTAQSAAPYSGFPSTADLQALRLTIPIVYTLNTK